MAKHNCHNYHLIFPNGQKLACYILSHESFPLEVNGTRASLYGSSFCHKNDLCKTKEMRPSKWEDEWNM